AIKVAEQVGAGKYYGKSGSDDGKVQERKLANNIDLLIQKMQQMSLNYTFLTSAIITQDKHSAKRPLPRPSPRTEGPENHRCYVCGKRGHLACSCRNKMNLWNGPSNPSSKENGRVNMAWVNTGGDCSSDKEQVFAGMRECPKPYNTNKRSLKEKRSESQREFNLRSHTKLDPMLVKNNHPTQGTPEKKLKSKRQLLVIDQWSYCSRGLSTSKCEQKVGGGRVVGREVEVNAVTTDLEESATKGLVKGEKELKKLKIKKKGKLEFSIISTRHCKDLRYKGRAVYYSDTYYVYKHKKLGSHYALTKLNLEEPVYLHHFFNYRLITHEPKQLILLQEQLLNAAQQELLRRKIQKELDVDIGTRQKINLELHEVDNSSKGTKTEEESEEARVCMVNAAYEPLSPISKESTPPNSNIEKELTADEDNDQQAIMNQKQPPVMVFELMCPRQRRRLVFVEECVDNGHEYYLYLHPTLGMHYAARRLDLRSAWVAEGAQRAGLDVNLIQQSELSAAMIEELTAYTNKMTLQ
ncbi:19451_t:CDS:2, partial [Gigaspora rosea]